MVKLNFYKGIIKQFKCWMTICIFCALKRWCLVEFSDDGSEWGSTWFGTSDVL